MRGNKKILILCGITVASIIIAMIMLLTFNVTKEAEPKFVDSDVVAIKEYKELSDITDGALRAKIGELINQGVNDCYNLNNRYFVILSTGESQEGLVYQTMTDYNTGKLKMMYRFAKDDNTDTALKIRYRVIEFNGPVVVEQMKTDYNNKVKQGIMTSIIYGGKDNLMEYYPEQGYRENSESGYTEGIYNAIYNNGEIKEYKKIDSIRIDNCKIMNKLLDNTYNVDIGHQNIVNIDIDDINLQYGMICELEISHNNGFKGKVIKKGSDAI